MQSEIQKSGTEVFPHALNYGHGGIFVYKWLSIGSFYYFYNTNILVVTILLYFCKEKDSY